MRQLAIRLTALSTVLGALISSGCGNDQEPEGAAELWSRIHDEKYPSWQRAPGFEERRESAGPHGGAVDIYVNDVVAAALAGGPITAWPDGSLIVKDGFDGGELSLIAAMEKRGSDWFWAEWDAEGDTLFSGKPATCTDCHQGGQDFVQAFPLPK